MTSSTIPPISLSDYLNIDSNKQIFEIVKRTIATNPDNVDLRLIPANVESPLTDRDVFSVVYTSSFSSNDKLENGDQDFGLTSAAFSLDFSESPSITVDYGQPLYTNYKVDIVPTLFGVDAYEFTEYGGDIFKLSSGYDLFETTSESGNPDVDNTIIFTDLEGVFPSQQQSIETPILDFSTSSFEDSPNLVSSVMGLSTLDFIPAGIDFALVEYSDDSTYASLIKFDDNIRATLLNDISSNDSDFVSFTVPNGYTVDNLILDDYIGPLSTSENVELGTISISPGNTYSSEDVVFSATFGNSLDSPDFTKGSNLFANYSLSPGTYSAKISHTGQGSFDLPVTSSSIDDSSLISYEDRGYHFSFSPTSDFTLTLLVDQNNFLLDQNDTPYSFVEDHFLNIPLPYDSDDLLRLSWSSVVDLPGSLTIIEPTDPSIPYSVQGLLPLDFNGDLELSLIAKVSDQEASKPVSFLLKVTPENDAPVAISPSESFLVEEDTTFVVQLQASDIDDQSSDLAFELINPLAHPELSLSPSGLLSIDATLDSFQSITEFSKQNIEFRVTDSAVDPESSVGIFDINFIGVNDAPIPSPNQSFSLDEDSTLTVQLQASDVDNLVSELSFELVEPTNYPQLLLTTSGELTIDASLDEYQLLGPPDAFYSQLNYSNIEYSVTDSGNDAKSAIGSFDLDIFGVNDKPILDNLQSILQSGLEDVSYTVSFDDLLVSSGYSDLDSYISDVYLNVKTVFPNSSLLIHNSFADARDLVVGDVLQAGDLIEWIPSLNHNGLLPVMSFSAFDSTSESDVTSTLSVNVQSADDPPSINDSQLNTSLTLSENSSFSKQYLSTDVDGDSVSWSVTGIDKDFFQIDQSGLLNLINLPDFESKNKFNVSVNITDDTPASLSDSSSLSLDITNEFERQTLSLSSPVHIPGSGNVLRSDLSFSQDLAIKADFSSEISFDPSSIRLDINSSDLSHFDSFQLDSGLLSLQTSDSSALSLDSGHLSFYALNPDDAGPFTLDLKQVSDSRIAPISDSKVIISSKADSFVDSTGHLDLSGFSAPLRILGGSLKADKQAEIISQGNFRMPYGDSSYTVNSVSTTSFDDELVAFEDLLSFSLNDGDDKISITSTLRDDIVGSLGLGRDSVHVDISSLNGNSLTIDDFELGFDELLTSSIDSNLVLKYRSDLFSSDLLEELGDVDIDLKISSFVKSIASSKLSSGELVPLSLPTQFVSGKSPIINSNIAIEPGDQGRTLVVQLLTQSESSSFSLLGENTPLSSFVRDDWEISSSNGSTLYISYIGDTPVGSAIQDISGLRQLLGSISVESSSEINFDVSFQWMSSSYASDSTVDGLYSLLMQIHSEMENSGSDNDQLLTSAVSLSELSGVSPNSLSLVPDHATSFASSAQINIAPEDGSVFQASSHDDHVSLLGEALRSKGQSLTDNSEIETSHVYGLDGNDTLIASDGSRIVGGLDHDILIAQRGSGTTQMVGGSGNDMLFGGSNDSLIGGIGADYLAVRGLGNRLIGGSGSDTFLLYDDIFEYSDEGGRGLNRILDFSSDDNIVLMHSLNSPTYQVSYGSRDTSAGLIVSFNDRDVAILQGITSDDVSDNQFLSDSLINPMFRPSRQFNSDIVSQINLLDQSV